MSSVIGSRPRSSVTWVDDRHGGLRWWLGAPLRFWLRHSPIVRGKGFVESIARRACMPRAGLIEHHLPSGSRIRLDVSERIGAFIALYGGFEAAELALGARMVKPGSVAMDVGANVGLFTVTLANAAGERGRVISVEPFPPTVKKLRSNIELNGLRNVVVVPCACGPQEGTAEMDAGLDPAFISASLGALPESAPERSGGSRVRMATLDSIWSECGRPAVSFLKVDVEGTEDLVFRGAKEFLATCRPAILCEITAPERRAAIEAILAPLGYALEPSPGLQPWNFLYLAR